MYNYLFGQNSLIINYRNYEIVIKPGDHCHVKSDRFETWFLDGVVTECYRDSLTVSYGFSQYFGFALTRGNTKSIKCNEITKFLRFPNASVLRSAGESLSPEEVGGLLSAIRDE